MRKIGSNRVMEKKRKIGTIIISIFILLLLVVGTVGYAFISNPGSITQRDNTPTDGVVDLGGTWAVTIQGRTFYFSNSPEEVRDIPVDITVTLQTYAGNTLYLDSEDQTVTQEILATLGQFSSRFQEVCQGSCPNRNLPEKDCTENLIVWRESDENKVFQQDNCVFIEGNLEAVDAFIYTLFGL